MELHCEFRSNFNSDFNFQVEAYGGWFSYVVVVVAAACNLCATVISLCNTQNVTINPIIFINVSR